jgi:hypothetical protein
MSTAVSNYPLNATQMFILRTFATARSEQEREELTSFYLDYIQQKLDKAANEFWDSHNLDNAQMEALMYGHLRSSGK